MITETITTGNQTWTIEGTDTPNPLADGPCITATLDGVTVDISYRYRQITSFTHTNGCTWGVRMNPICTCAPQPEDPEALFAAALDVQTRCFAAINAAEDAERRGELQRWADEDAWRNEPNRITVVGSDRGWLRWDTDRNWSTGEIVAPPGSITHLDARPVGIVDDAFCLYSIRRP